MLMTSQPHHAQSPSEKVATRLGIAAIMKTDMTLGRDTAIDKATHETLARIAETMKAAMVTTATAIIDQPNQAISTVLVHAAMIIRIIVHVAVDSASQGV